nr:hypothetical protein [Rhodococcus erythropolis]
MADTLLYAQVSARSGDLDTACRLADSVIAEPDLDNARLAAAVRIRAASSAACGQLRAAADLYTWLGPGRTETESPFAAITFLGIGNVDDANAALTGHTGSPSSSTVGAATLANGLMQSVTGECTECAQHDVARTFAPRRAPAHLNSSLIPPRRW